MGGDYHKQSIKQSGIVSMEIYRVENRLCMLVETVDNFSFEEKNKQDSTNRKVQEWETLMWKYQQAIPGPTFNEKWRLMNQIFSFS